MRKIVLVFVVFFLLVASDCNAFWIWSPKTGKWINPVYRTFDTPLEQFNWAKGYFDEKDYKKAIFEFKKIIKKFPESEFAPEAKFFIALCEKELRKYYRAFKTFQSIIVDYPLNKRLGEIVEQQYLIGEIYLQRRKYVLAKEIFEKTLINSPYSKVSDVLQYKIGICSLKLNRFNDARDEFGKIAENYSSSPYLDKASFQAAVCSYEISKSVKNYDEKLVDRAIEDMEYFMKRFQTATDVPQGQKLLDILKYSKAEKLFQIARFYEKQNKKFAALKYYDQLVFAYRDSTWAQKAKPRMELLRSRK